MITINGFYLTDVGYDYRNEPPVESAVLMRDGKKLGEYHKWYEGQYKKTKFIPEEGVNVEALEDEIRKFPPDRVYCRVYPCEWNLGLLIDDLLFRINSLEHVNKLNESGEGTLVIVRTAKGRLQEKVVSVRQRLAQCIEEEYGDDCTWKVMVREEDFCEVF